jgi:hypothetical protein
MNIPYLTQPGTSQFYPLIIDALRAAGPISRGQSLSCNMERPGGYDGSMLVDIVEGNEFITDWGNPQSDPTCFPAGIRAAATALRDANFTGR